MSRIALATLAGIAGAVIGWIAFAAITLAAAYVLGASSHDGGLEMSAFFGVGPVGGLIGFLAGSIIALRRGRDRQTGAVLARLPLVVLAAAGLIGIIAAGLWYARPLSAPNSMPPELLFEVRLPPGTPPFPLVSRSEALARRSPIELRTPQNTMTAEITSARDDAGRWVVSGRVEMPLRVDERILAVKAPGGAPEVLFRVKLVRSPAPTADFSSWEPDTGNRQFEIRYRVARDSE